MSHDARLLERLHAAHVARLEGAEREGRVIDPLCFPRRYADPADQEVAAFLAQGLAFGRIALFAEKLEALFAALGPRPREAILAFPARGRLLPGFRYRFIGDEDLHCFLYQIGQMLRRSGSIEAFFMAGQRPGDLKASLADFVARALALPVDGFYEATALPEGVGNRFFWPSPRSSAAKRLCLFLRWMVRAESPDLGVWRGLSPAELVIPLDTHVAQQARARGWLKGTAQNWAAAERVTAALREWCPEDPLRYDFALCHDDIAPQPDRAT
jgi:uncharacterized protein (TIGR02757 family)